MCAHFLLKPTLLSDTSQKDCACAVTKFIKLLFLTSVHCTKNFHTQGFFYLKEYGIKQNVKFFHVAKISANLRISEAEICFLKLNIVFEGNIFTKSVHTLLRFPNLSKFR